MWLGVACVSAAAACRLTRAAAGSSSNAVDMYNSASGTWSTAQLSVARRDFSATSVGNVAIFAGGSTGNSSVPSHFEVLLFGLLWVRDACLRHVAWCCLCFRCSSLPSHEGHCRRWSVQCCGYVQQCIGHMVDCSAQCGARNDCSHICWERGHLRGGWR